MRITLPTYDDIVALHQKYAPTDEVFELVFTHCQIVRDIALQLAHTSGAAVDTELVTVGCLLHDIGVYALHDTHGQELADAAYITHGIRGEEMLRREGFAETICRFASHHTGAGLSKQQIITRGLPLPHQDYLAETAEEALVMYADKFHSKSQPPQFNSHAYYTQFTAQFGDESSDSFAQLTAQFGVPELTGLARQYGHSLR